MRAISSSGYGGATASVRRSTPSSASGAGSPPSGWAGSRSSNTLTSNERSPAIERASPTRARSTDSSVRLMLTPSAWRAAISIVDGLLAPTTIGGADAPSTTPGTPSLEPDQIARSTAMVSTRRACRAARSPSTPADEVVLDGELAAGGGAAADPAHHPAGRQRLQRVDRRRQLRRVPVHDVGDEHTESHPPGARARSPPAPRRDRATTPAPATVPLKWS